MHVAPSTAGQLVQALVAKLGSPEAPAACMTDPLLARGVRWVLHRGCVDHLKCVALVEHYSPLAAQMRYWSNVKAEVKASLEKMQDPVPYLPGSLVFWLMGEMRWGPGRLQDLRRTLAAAAAGMDPT